MSESPVNFFVNPSAFDLTPQRSRLQSYPNPHLMSKSVMSPHDDDDDSEQFRCFSLPRFDKEPPDPAPMGVKDILSTSTSSEQLRHREELLTEQHRKVVAERLQEQEEERNARQRLEDIIDMCAQFVASNEVSPSPSSSAIIGHTNHSVHQTSLPNLVSSNVNQMDSVLNSSSSNNVPAQTPTLLTNLRKNSIGSPTNGIKTNGSLKAATPSSEDELTAINNQKDACSPVGSLAPSSPVSPSTPQSPRNKIKTVPGIPSPKDSLARLENVASCSTGATTLGSLHSPNTLQHAPKTVPISVSSCSLQAQLNKLHIANSSSTSKLSHEPGSKPLSLSNGVSSHHHTHTTSTGLQQIAQQMQLAQASLLQSQYLALEATFKESLDELHMELALVAGELCDEQFSLKENLIQFGKLEAEQEMLLKEAIREKQNEQLRLKLAEERILKWQELTVKMAETLEDDVSPALEREISSRLENEVECLEAEKRAYEDLEFQVLESSARRDERIEEVNQNIQLMSQLIEQKEARIQELILQQKAIQLETDAKKREWMEEERNHASHMKLISQQQSSLDSESLSDSEGSESEYQHSNCGSEMVSSSTESEELFSPKCALGGVAASAGGMPTIALRNSHGTRGSLNRLSQRPLTCYLPVMPDRYLDLRQHLTSCGHQVELCRADVTLGEHFAKGYLYKLGSASRWWKKKWFVFDRVNCALLYYMDKSERKLKGVIHFASIEDVYVDHANKKMSSFCVKTVDRIFHLSATSPEVMRMWVDIIFSGAQAHIRFGRD